MADSQPSTWYQPPAQWKGYAVAAIIGSLLSFAGTFGVAQLEHDATMQRDEFARLESLADRYEARLEYRLQRERAVRALQDSMVATISSLKKQVADLQWTVYQQSLQIDALEAQLKSLGEVPVMPPQLLDLYLRVLQPAPPEVLACSPVLTVYLTR